MRAKPGSICADAKTADGHTTIGWRPLEQTAQRADCHAYLRKRDRHFFARPVPELTLDRRNQSRSDRRTLPDETTAKALFATAMADRLPRNLGGSRPGHVSRRALRSASRMPPCAQDNDAHRRRRQQCKRGADTSLNCAARPTCQPAIRRPRGVSLTGTHNLQSSDLSHRQVGSFRSHH
ncbi:hypothetical protein SPH9361_04101 [Sphingobium sp. CECT 9361]|nr:hypothetical protein SPH9361_04101 [Sphingobium sp. CECT 9361]